MCFLFKTTYFLHLVKFFSSNYKIVRFVIIKFFSKTN